MNSSFSLFYRFCQRKKNNAGQAPPAPIQPVTREYDQNVYRNPSPNNHNNNNNNNNYGEPPAHETEKAPEFNGVRPEPRILRSPSQQNEDGQTTKLLQTPVNSYFTYNRVPWKLNIRKEVSGRDDDGMMGQ